MMPITSKGENPKITVNNETNEFKQNLLVSESGKLIEMMKGKHKAFFYGHIDEKDRLIIHKPAPRQVW